ncbi:GH92 family glycosyl hydrolase, partial [Bacteroidota bacterium]
MKRKNTFIIVIVLFICLLIMNSGKQQDLVKHVNPLVGTESSFKLSNGNTYPAIALPWGMNFWTPQTGKNGDGWAYTYDAKTIRGIKLTHQPSPWINDYGCFSLMPVTGKLVVNEKERASEFSHENETVKPYYYSVELEKYNVFAELTPTDRCAKFRFTFDETDDAYILLDAYQNGSYVKIIPEENKIIGYSTNNHGGVPDNFACYYVAVFDKEFSAYGTWINDSISLNNSEEKGEHVGGIVKFSCNKAEKINVKVGASFISFEQAERNLKNEIAEKSFDKIKNEGKKSWNKELNKIQVEGGSEGQLTTFYTALYRTMLFPRKFYEFNEDNEIVHYSPYDGGIHPGYMFTDNGFWDTFRAVFPFFTLLYPEMDGQIMQGLVNAYNEGGWLPEWASPGYRNCMIGAHAASLIADAYVKGIRNFDAEKAWEAMVNDASNVAPMPAIGRLGVEYYNELGYVPVDVGINEAAARSLEYAYDDFCMKQMAEALNKPKEIIEKYEKRAYNYKNLFDPSTRFMRGKNKDGSWQDPFVPVAWGGAFTEGNAWHYTWSVFQDPQGLIDLMGSKANFISKLDSVFSVPPDFDCSYYGFEIHEITEMVRANMGQYAHGNQPIQHMIYLYNYAGEPWKTQKWARYVMDNLYGPEPDGLCGDEDNGQTSAWYVFSAMGFYPVCPGSPEYVTGSPLFKKITLNLPGNKIFEIIANNNSDENIYLQSAKLNNKNYTKNFLLHEDI